MSPVLSSYPSPSRDAAVAGASRDTNTLSERVGGRRRRRWWCWKHQHLFMYVQDDGGRAPAEGANCAMVGMVRHVIPPRKEGPPSAAVKEQGPCHYLSPHFRKMAAPPVQLTLNRHVEASISETDKECKCTHPQTVGARCWCCKHILLTGSRPYAAPALSDRISDD